MTNGCLIVNLGSPDEPTEESIRQFLRAMLSDRSVVNLPPVLWKPILHGIILRRRPSRLVERYRQIWTDEGSPLMKCTHRQAEKLRDALPDVEVKYAFCYSHPTIEEALADWDVDALTVIPAYPQEATSTVAPLRRRVLDFYESSTTSYPLISFAGSYPTEPHMVAWYQEQISEYMAALPADDPLDHIVLSFHGVPAQRYHKASYYRAQCEATANAIMAAFPTIAYTLTFQSKFGKGEWLTPATSDVTAELPSRGAKNILVLTPAFVADCLETLEEICIDNRDRFMRAGGERFAVVPPINDEPAFIDTLVSVYRSVQTVSPCA